MTDAPMTRERAWRGIVAVWIAALAGAILVGIFAPAAMRFSWLAIVLAACSILAFVIQLATTQKAGFIDRISASVAGAFVVLAIAAAVVGFSGLFAG